MSKHYKIVGSAPFPKGIGDFSAANGGKIIMKQFAVVEIVVWAVDFSQRYEPNTPRDEYQTVPVKIHVNCLIADNIFKKNVISLGSVLQNGWNPSKKNGMLTLESDDKRLELHIQHFQNCPWLMHEFDLGESKFEIVGNPNPGDFDSWQIFEKLPSSAYQMPVQSSEASAGSGELSLPLHVSVKRDQYGNEVPLHRSRGKQTPVVVEELPADDVAIHLDEPPIKHDESLAKFPHDRPVSGDVSVVPRGAVELKDDSQHPKVQQRQIELQKHVMRGHFPYHPDCIACRQGKSTYQHRRKKEGKDIHELSCDFFFYEGQKFLAMTDSYTGMIAALPAADTEKARQWVRHWISEFGLIGPLSLQHPLEIFTDAEKSVGSLIRESDIGRPIRIQKAAPQAHESVGAAEGCIRKLKDAVATVRSSIREFGVDIANSDKARCCIFAYVSFCSNAHSRYRDGLLAPREILVGRSLPAIETTLYGSLVLAEIPESLKRQSIARFEKAIYLRPEFSSLGHVCASHLRAFVAKSIEVLVPIEFDLRISHEFLVDFKIGSHDSDKRAIRDDPGKDDRRQQIFESGPNPDTVKSVPAKFIREHGPTSGCNKCNRRTFHGYVHSRKCLERYRKFLRDEEKKLTEGASHEAPEKIVVQEAKVPKALEGSEPSVKVPMAEGSAVEPGLHMDEGRFQLEAEMEALDYVPTPPGELAEMADADLTGGDAPDSPELFESVDVEMLEGMQIDPILEGPIYEYDPIVMEKIQDNVAGMVNSVYFKKESETAFEVVDLCGSHVVLYKPSWVVSDTTGDSLDLDQTFEGMKVETASMTSQAVGKPMREEEMKQYCKVHKVKPISCRWVNGQKTEVTVRSRLVARQIAKGGGNARDLAISSPTSSSESLRLCLAECGLRGLCVLGLDVSAAFMASPITEKVVLMLPTSYAWEDGSRVYLLCYKALNGLRSSGKAWVLHLGSVAKKASLTAGRIETTLFAGYFLNGPDWVQVVSYVDDILIFSESMKVCQKVYDYFASHLKIKETGRIDKQNGQIKFLGREISRKNGECGISISIPDGYFTPCFEAFGIAKGSDVPPDFRSILDDQSEALNQEISQESYERYRSVLGKLSWASQTRQDLVIYLSLLSLGMARPLQKHEKAMRALLRFLFNQQTMIQYYPPKEQIEEMHLHSYKLIGYTGSSWAPLECLRRRSISGGFIFFHGCCVKSYSRIQQTVALSSCEAELGGICEMCVELQGLERLAAHLFGCEFETDMIRTDSQAAIRVLKGQGLQRRSRHVEIRVFHVQDLIQQDSLVIEWAEGSKMIADLATKTLGKKLYDLFSTALGFESVEVTRKSSSAKNLYSCLQVLLGIADSGIRSLSLRQTEKPKKIQPLLGDFSSFPCLMNPVKKSHVLFGGIFRCDELSSLTFDRVNFKLIFIEICCGEESMLCKEVHRHSDSILCIRVTEDACIEKYRSQIQSFLRKVQQLKPEVSIYTHLSAPCTGGSNLISLQHDSEERRRVHFQGFCEILKHSSPILKISTDWSFELPKRNNYWKEKHVQQYLCDHAGQARLFCCAPKLCKLLDSTEYPEGVPRPSKAYLILSTCVHVIDKLMPFHTCSCQEHAVFNDVDWTKTGFYPKLMAKKFSEAVVRLTTESKAEAAERKGRAYMIHNIHPSSDITRICLKSFHCKKWKVRRHVFGANKIVCRRKGMFLCQMRCLEEETERADFSSKYGILLSWKVSCISFRSSTFHNPSRLTPGSSLSLSQPFCLTCGERLTLAGQQQKCFTFCRCKKS